MASARIASIVLLALASFAALAPPAGAVAIVNGSMEHTGGTNYLYFNGYIAPGWIQDNSATNPLVYTTSPDIFDPTMTAFSMAWVASPDGGKFAHSTAWIDGENQEGFTQTLTGLSVGTQYDVSFFQAITDTNFTPSGIAGQWQVRFGSTTVYSAPMLAPSPTVAYGWDLQTLSFVATAPTQELSFLARSVDAVEPVYLGLDGVSIRELAVPEPAGLLLLAIALAAPAWRSARDRAGEGVAVRSPGLALDDGSSSSSSGRGTAGRPLP